MAAYTLNGDLYYMHTVGLATLAGSQTLTDMSRPGDHSRPRHIYRGTVTCMLSGVQSLGHRTQKPAETTEAQCAVCETLDHTCANLGSKAQTNSTQLMQHCLLSSPYFGSWES